MPPAVAPGDRVGVAALSSAVDAEELERGMTALEELGFEPVPARNLGSEWGIHAGRPQERLDAFHELAADDSIRAILFARGGYGLLPLLPHLDWDLLGRHPRAYVGFSDLTPFLLGVVDRLGLVAFHGPMVAKDIARGLDGDERATLLACLGGDLPIRIPVGGWWRPEPASGRVVGGCLTLLTATLGTPFAPRLDDALLFVEDVDEEPYSVDRMLTHLRLSGSLAEVRGMIVGHLGSTSPLGEELEPWRRDAFLAASGPVAHGIPCGHGEPHLTMPLGLVGRLDPATDSLLLGP